MTYRLKQLAIFLIVIAVIGLASNQVFGMNATPFITKYTTKTGIVLYKYDFKNYFLNLKTNITSLTALKIDKPTTTWATTGDPLNLANLTTMFNWFLYAINWLLYPIRIGGYLLCNLFAILGLNINPQVNTPLYWFTGLAREMRDLIIPYVTY